MKDIKIDVDGKKGMVGSYCSWEALNEILKHMNYIHRDESLSHLTITEKGFTYYRSKDND